MNDESSDARGGLRAVGEQLTATNALLAEWTARSAEDSPQLIERLEQMGYEVRGKSRDVIIEILKYPPTRAVRAP